MMIERYTTGSNWPKLPQALLKALVLFICSMVFSYASAQSPEQQEPRLSATPIKSQPNTVGNLTCGVVVMFLGSPPSPTQRTLLIQATLQLDATSQAIRAAFVVNDYLGWGTAQQMAESERFRPVNSGWFKTEGLKDTQPLNGTAKRQNPTGALSYETNNKSDLQILKGLLNGKRIEVGIQLADQNSPVIVEGIVFISESNRMDVLTCIDIAQFQPIK